VAGGVDTNNDNIDRRYQLNMQLLVTNVNDTSNTEKKENQIFLKQSIKKFSEDQLQSYL
jgi:hypothetical protein